MKTKTDPITQFQHERNARISSYQKDSEFNEHAREWVKESMQKKYVYNFDWLSRPIIQYPQDIVGMQEIIWKVKPDLIIETGIAHGGSLVFSASMLALLDMCDAIDLGDSFDPRASKRRVLGIDIDIRKHNRVAIEEHPMSSRIQMIQGSSVAPEIIEQVYNIAKDYQRILVCLDSNHTYEHVLGELNAYAPLASVGSYCVVFDTFVDDLPENFFENRAWGPKNNPKMAVAEYLKMNSEFDIDKSIQDKLLITVAPGGYLVRS